MTTKRASVESTADAYLELLAARGVEYFFANSGTDFAPLIDAYARRLDRGLPAPTITWTMTTCGRPVTSA